MPIWQFDIRMLPFLSVLPSHQFNFEAAAFMGRIRCADRSPGFGTESQSHHGEAGPRGCFFVLIGKAGREDERCRGGQAPMVFRRYVKSRREGPGKACMVVCSDGGMLNEFASLRVGGNEMGKRFKVGDHVTWNSEAGHVSGRIIKVHSKNVDYKGYTHHATQDEPQYEIKSDKTDHIAMHKGSALKKLGAK